VTTAKVIPLRQAPESDEALIAACARQEPDALREIFRRHHAVVYRFVSRLIGAGNPAVDDAVQLTFLTAWRRADSFSGRAAVRSWLFGIAANVARDHRRSERRRLNVFDVFKTRPAPEPPLIDDVVSRKQLVEKVMAALDDLPHDLRVAYVLCELEDVPGVDAARAVGVRPGTMWKRLHQARRRLREVLREETT
jgi:RNA polymerase sigma-70 factor (ECF subfamily)